MEYRIDTSYCWLEQNSDDYQIVKMYFINSIPFTFDELPSIIKDHPDVLKCADKNRSFCMEDLYKSSFYLIDEQAHPCLFPVPLENPEDMPDD